MSHQHVPVAASRRTRLLLTALLAPVLLATVVGGLLLRAPDDDAPRLETMAPGSSVAEVTVTAIDPDATDMAQLAARTADGDEVEVHAPPEYLPEIEVGDAVRVIVLPTADLAGAPPGTPTHVFVDFVRGPPMLLLAGVMAVLVVAVARLRGAAALLGLGLSLAGLAWFTLPALIAGRPAAAVAVVSATGIMVVVLYLVHGFSARTSTALVGTVVGILLTAGIGAWATGATHLTGLGGENSLDLLQLAPGMSLSGVLLCGLVLAGLGVLNDVTITQASAVWELRASSPTASRREVFARAMRIGRDHIASTVYTVAFAYVGAALPLVLLVAMSDRAVLDVLSAGEVAEEIVRTLVGSIGLVLAIPVTTALGALVAGPGSLASADDVVEDREAVEV
ncbi:YibE/F family protein [Actinotalea ferrariae]|uniref:YibE/F family protein n=1 Tax=Actinotalea ferrariae TaxID=1386098 RepID=UPI0027E203CC|nr:YibE/F family protein [Actinotalea ferrariae]